MIWPNLNGFDQNNITGDTTRNPMKPELPDPTSILGWFRVLFSPTRKFQVEFESGTNLTWLDP